MTENEPSDSRITAAMSLKLCNPNGAAALRRAGKGGVALREAVRGNADEFARELAPVVEAVRAEGYSTLRDIAGQLDARGMLTRRGGRWQVSNVRNLLARIGLKEGKLPAVS